MVFNSSGVNRLRIKDLALLERPREKALAYGVKHLSTKELLAVFIGQGIAGNSALNMAETLLNEHGSLTKLLSLKLHEWRTINGISTVKALQFLVMFELFQRLEKEGVERISFKDPKAIYDHFRLRFASLHHEQLVIIKLNHHLQYTGETLLRIGNKDSIQLDARDVFLDLLKSDTKKFVLIHNHPSGEVTPSQDDISTTHFLKKEATALGFKLIDHIIISWHHYFSMREQGLI